MVPSRRRRWSWCHDFTSWAPSSRTGLESISRAMVTPSLVTTGRRSLGHTTCGRAGRGDADGIGELVDAGPPWAARRFMNSIQLAHKCLRCAGAMHTAPVVTPLGKDFRAVHMAYLLTTASTSRAKDQVLLAAVLDSCRRTCCDDGVPSATSRGSAFAILPAAGPTATTSFQRLFLGVRMTRRKRSWSRLVADRGSCPRWLDVDCHDGIPPLS